MQRLPSGEDIHIDNETGAFATHSIVSAGVGADVQYRTKAFTDSSEEQNGGH